MAKGIIMSELLRHFFHMGGYGLYVFSAYGSVITLLTIQWLIPWRRWQHYLREQKRTS